MRGASTSLTKRPMSNFSRLSINSAIALPRSSAAPSRSSWRRGSLGATVYFVMAALVIGVMVVALTAPDTQRPPKNVIEQGLEQAGEISASVRLAALSHRRPLLGLGDHHARRVHGFDACCSASRDEAALGCGLHRQDWSLDHRCNGVRASGHCRRSELAEGTWQRRPAREPSPVRPGAER